LRVIRCPTLQVSQFLFPGQRSDTFLTDHVHRSFYNKIATVSFCDVLEWLSICVCASSVAINDAIIVFPLPLDCFWCTRGNDFLLSGQNNYRFFKLIF